jgi:hypothetical protein
MAEHEHSHTMTTECNGPECGVKHNMEFNHSHEHGHDLHAHRLDGVKIIRLEEEIEPSSESEPVKQRSGHWLDDLDTE